MNISQTSTKGTLNDILDQHDLKYEQLLGIKKKKSPEYLKLLDEIIELRIEYNRLCGREMFQV